MLYMEALMEDKPADYQSLEEILYTYTDGFTKEEGSYPLKDRADRENAAAILKKYYNEVSKNNLDIKRQDDDGTVDYKVYFSDPKMNFEDENTLNEARELPSGYEHVFTNGEKLIHRKKPFKTKKGEMIVSSLDEKKKRKPELNVMPDKNPANIPASMNGNAAAGGMGMGEGLNEAGPRQSKAYPAALAVAKGFKGVCGSYGGKDPKVNQVGNEAEITFWSQLPQETYVIHSDLSVDFQFDRHNVDAYEDYGFDSKDEAIAFWEDNTYWPSIKDWLNDDEHFGWAGGLSSKEINAILKDVNDSINGDIVDFTDIDNRENNVKNAFNKEIGVLERDGFEYASYIACMQYEYSDGSSMLVAFPGKYNSGLMPWRLIYMVKGNNAGTKMFNTFDDLYDFMGDDLQMESLKEGFSNKYTDEEAAKIMQLGFELDDSDVYESWRYHFDDGAQFDLYKWVSFDYGPGIADTNETWILDYINSDDVVQSTKECKNLDDMLVFMKKMSEQLEEAKISYSKPKILNNSKKYVPLTDKFKAPELEELGFKKLDSAYRYNFDKDSSMTVYVPRDMKSYSVYDHDWIVEYLDFSQPEDGNWKVIRRFDTYKEVLEFIYNNMEESLKEKVEKHDELNKDLWNDNKELRPEVKDKILEIVNKFKENLEQDEVNLDIDDVVIIGSNASYNYTNNSDIDVHIVADVSEYDDYGDLAMKCYQAYKSLWNNKYDPMIRGHEVELYVEPGQVRANSNGMYSIISGWLKEPVKDNIPEVDQKEVDDMAKPFIERAKQANTIDDIDELIDDIYVLRQEGILEDGEYSIKNLCFKKFRDEGYLSDLKDKKVELENDEMSIR